MKTSIDGYIILLKKLKKYLQNYIKNKKFSPMRIIVDNQTITNKIFYNYFLRLKSKRNLKNSFLSYSFRHTFDSKMLLNGNDIYTVSKLLPYTFVKITEKIYVRHNINNLKVNSFLC